MTRRLAIVNLSNHPNEDFELYHPGERDPFIKDEKGEVLGI